MIENYINIPYLNRGRSLSGADCWGLAILIYKNELDIELPSYGDISAENLIEIHRTMNKDKDCEIWVDIPKGQQKKYDICLMSSGKNRKICHAGIVLDKKTIIHIEKGVDSCVVPINHFSIRERILCYRRHIKMK